MTMQDIPLYDRPAFRRAAGLALRPGGPELTRRALKLGEEFCGLRPGGRVLDAGCGPGVTLELCAALGFAPVGVDLRPDSAETARGAPFPILRADIRRLPLADACCDAVICECVLSLLPDPETALAEACRVLRRGAAVDGSLSAPGIWPPPVFTEALSFFSGRLSSACRRAIETELSGRGRTLARAPQTPVAARIHGTRYGRPQPRADRAGRPVHFSGAEPERLGIALPGRFAPALRLLAGGGLKVRCVRKVRHPRENGYATICGRESGNCIRKETTRSAERDHEHI